MSTGVAPALPGPLKALLVAAVVLFVGAAVLQRAGPAGRSDPVASVDNGGPRGWLLVALALAEAGRPALRVDSDAALAAVVGGHEPDVVVLVPPPEQTVFSAAEVAALRDTLARGARVVVVCDPDKERKKRLRPLLADLGVRCVGDTDAPSSTTLLAVPPLRVFVRDGGRVVVEEEALGVLPLAPQDSEGIGPGLPGAVVSVGAGELVVLGSGSALANDGLTEGDNARLLWWLVRGRSRVVVDERHHLTRGAAAWQRASLQGPGPITALVGLLLLIPLTILALAPRRGELAVDEGVEVPAAVARVRGLAALLASSAPATPPRAPASPSPTSPSPSPSPSPPPSPSRPGGSP